MKVRFYSSIEGYTSGQVVEMSLEEYEKYKHKAHILGDVQPKKTKKKKSSEPSEVTEQINEED